MKLCVASALLVITLCQPAFGQKDTEDIIKGLVIATKDSDAKVRKAAFTGLARSGKSNMQVLAALQAGLKDKDVAVRGAALLAVVKLVKDVDTKARALIDVIDDKAVQPVDEFGDPVPGLSQLARRHLKKLGPAAIPHLVHALKDDRKKLTALRVLKHLEPAAEESAQDFSQAILAMLKDGQVKVRKAAIDALAAMETDPEKVVPRLCEMLTDNNADVRRAAVMCLTKFAPHAKAAVPKLIKLLNDNDPRIRQKVVKCLTAMVRTSGRPADIDREVWQYARHMMKVADQNGDGKLQFRECADLDLDLDKFDMDNDREISMIELAWGISKLGVPF